MKNYFHIMKHISGGWQAKREGSIKASIITSTKFEAEKFAKKLLSKQGGGEVKLHNKYGQIIDSDTVKPANDPYPPKDIVH